MAFTNIDSLNLVQLLKELHRMYIFLDGKEYAKADSMWHAQQILDELCEAYENLEYTDPECGCIYAVTNGADASTSGYAETNETRTMEEYEEIEAEDGFSDEVQKCVNESQQKMFEDLVAYGESYMKAVWDNTSGIVHRVSEVGRFEVGMQLPMDSQGVAWEVVSLNRTDETITIAPVIATTTAQDIQDQMEKLQKKLEVKEAEALNQAIATGFNQSFNSIFGGAFSPAGQIHGISTTSNPNVTSSGVQGLNAWVSPYVNFPHGGKVGRNGILDGHSEYLLVVRGAVRRGKFVRFPSLTSNAAPTFEFSVPSEGMIYIVSEQEVWDNLYYVPDVVLSTNKPSCQHEYVNVGFMHTKFACKHCGRDQ